MWEGRNAQIVGAAQQVWNANKGAQVLGQHKLTSRQSYCGLGQPNTAHDVTWDYDDGVIPQVAPFVCVAAYRVVVSAPQ